VRSERSAGDDPFDGLTGDLGDAVVVRVVVNDREVVASGDSGDEKIRQGESMVSASSRLVLDIDGSVHVTVGSFPHGQSHETVVAQVVAEEMGLIPDMVNVAIGFDTVRNVHTGQNGTYASQFAVTGLSAVHGAVELLKAELKELAVFALGAAGDGGGGHRAPLPAAPLRPSPPEEGGG